MGILADLDSVIARKKVAKIYMGEGALHAFWAQVAQRHADTNAAIIRVNGNWAKTAYRGIPVVPADWPHGWEIAEAA